MRDAIRRNVEIGSTAVELSVSHCRHWVTVTGDGVTITYVTVVDLFNEWQGTIIAQFYDSAGAFIEQYVADMVITRSEYSPSDWMCRYDLKFEADGIGYINHRPGMFTNFIVGTPILQQPAPPPLSLSPSQFTSTDLMNTFYALYPEQTLYDVPPVDGGDGGTILPILTRFTKPQGPFQRAPQASEVIRVQVVGGNAFAREVGIQGTGIVTGCGVAAMLGAVGFGGCVGAGMSGVIVVSALNNLRIRNR